jgi:hypothetical protein
MFATPGSRFLSMTGGLQTRWGMTNRAVTVLQQSGQGMTGNTWTQAQWNTLSTDDVGAYRSSANTILTVPAGWTRARMKMMSSWRLNSSGIFNCYIQLQKNGATIQQTIRQTAVGDLGAISPNGACTFLATQWLTGLVPGDQFTFWVLESNVGGGVTWGANFSWPTWWTEWAR